MPRKISLFLSFILLVMILMLLFHWNPQAVTIVPWFGVEYSLPLAFVMIGYFCLGAIVAALFAFVGSLNYSWKTKKLKKKVALAGDHVQQIIRSREQLAAGNHNRARQLLKGVLQKEPDNILARISLAEMALNEGDTTGAIHTLDQARAEQHQNLELLFLGARINSELGNETAAYDNLSLVLKHDPNNVKALTMLVERCRRLDRHAEAAQLQEQLIRLVKDENKREAQDVLAWIELQKLSQELPSTPEEQRVCLEEFLRRHRNYSPALAKLAQIEILEQRYSQASKTLIKAFRFSQDTCYLEQLAKLWLDLEQPQRAVSSIEDALQAAAKDGNEIQSGRIFHTRLFLHLDMLDQAENNIRGLESMLKTPETVPHQSEVFEQIRILRALLEFRRKNFEIAILSLMPLMAKVASLPPSSLFNNETSLTYDGLSASSTGQHDNGAPSPQLSTP